MIGIASTFFWIFLIGFAVSAALSVKDLNFSFGEPQIEVTEDSNVVFSLPIILTNRGLYSIRSFDISTRISDLNGYVVAEGSTSVPVIGRDEEVIAFHNITIDVDDVLQRNQNCLFNDTEFRINEKLSLTVAEVVPVRAVLNHTMLWGAPLYNLTIGSPQIEVYNLTHLRGTVPISFENHAMFDLAGAIQVHVYDNAGLLTSVEESALNVGQHSFYNEAMDFFIPYSLSVRAIPSGHIEVYIRTLLFNYGPVRINYG